MKSVIVVVEPPKNEQQWKNFIGASGTQTASEHVQELSDNVWQIDFEKSPTSFGQLLHAMKQYGIPGRILPLAPRFNGFRSISNP